MGGLIDHAKIEFEALGYIPTHVEQENGPNLWIQENVIELLEVFSKQGHSGSSAPYCIEMFRKLALYEPLGPITGNDSEWNLVDEHMWQNNRCSHVFKDVNSGVAYDIDGYHFKDQDGNCFGGSYSSRLVTFPYTPSTIYVDVISYTVNKETGEPEVGTGWWETEYPDFVLEESRKLDELRGRVTNAIPAL